MERTERADLRSLTLEQLEAFVVQLGERQFRGRQIFGGLHRRRARTWDELTELPKPFRARLAETARLATLVKDVEQRSADGTIKFRFRTVDGHAVEAVYLPDEDRKTLCVSTQVGCAMGCTFCMTATLGLTRHLGAGEIVDQVHRVNEELRAMGDTAERPLTNLVFMGMGEPLHNYDNVKTALEILLHPEGPGFSHRHITVSTVGLVPAIERFGRETEVKLAISLNAPNDEKRERIMPVNRKWKIADLVEACRSFPARQGRRVTFEYVLLREVNDGDADARELAQVAKRAGAKVNLIPYNANPGLPFASVDEARATAFRDILVRAGVVAVVRKNRGRDIAAACGQLANLPGEGGDGRLAPDRTAAPGLPRQEQSSHLPR